ncbi:MAG: ATP-dependent DNA helicase, partial [Leptolyngbyaceae bacterium]|nr:ATP-dependent DNA helicase [Leptolyngbyaceae bacterium]
PIIIDGTDDLETWTRDQLTVCLQPSHWHELMLACPNQLEAIRDAKVRLTRAIFQHPPNPYECYLMEPPEQTILHQLYADLEQLPGSCLPHPWQQFQQCLQTEAVLTWTTIARPQGQFSLYGAPIDVAPALEKIWSQQPIVLIGTALDLDPEATLYRQHLGLGEVTSLKFSPDRHHELIQLYLPDGLPLPNTPQFQAALMNQLRALLHLSANQGGISVFLVGDVPLKAQVGAVLAAEFGSRVQVEKTCLEDNGILITGWEFWRQHQAHLPAPQVLAIATLPIPSLEHPLVAGRVAYYKRLRQDWFRLYLLPSALSELQRAIAPVRESQGLVALFDSRVLHRSYGQQVLSALSPAARINYLDPSLFSKSDYSIME